MCKRRFKTFRDIRNDPKIYEFTCDEVKLLKDHWLQEFRKTNYSDIVEKSRGKDPAYEKYKCELDEFLDECEDNKS